MNIRDTIRTAGFPGFRWEGDGDDSFGGDGGFASMGGYGEGVDGIDYGYGDPSADTSSTNDNNSEDGLGDYGIGYNEEDAELGTGFNSDGTGLDGISNTSDGLGSSEDSGVMSGTFTNEGVTTTVGLDGSYTTRDVNGNLFSYDATTDVTQTYDAVTGLSTVTSFDPDTGKETTQSFTEASEATKAKEEAQTKAASKLGAAIGGLVFGPIGTVVGYWAGGQIHTYENPQSASTVADSIGAMEDSINSSNSISLSDDEYSGLLSGESYSVGFSSNDGTVTPMVREQTIDDKYGDEGMTQEQLNAEQLQMAKDKQESWDAIYKPIEENLSDYYSTLTPDSYEAKSVIDIQNAYQQQTRELSDAMEQRGLSDSGAWVQAQTDLAMGAARDKATAHTLAPQMVADQQSNFLKIGTGQAQGIQAQLNDAYTNTSNMLNNQAMIDSNKDIAEDNSKNQMYGAIANLGIQYALS